MATPTSKLTYSVDQSNPLTVNFFDKSSDGPTSWSWDFGDGTAPDATKNPQHTYSASGFFTVTLIATNGEGAGTTATRNIGVSISGLCLPMSISDTVEYEIPASVTISDDYKDYLIKKWQLYVAPLANHTISNEDIYNEFVYTALENTLIIKCTILELLVHAATLYFMGLGTDGVNLISQVKKVVTGPAEVTYSGKEEIADAWKDVLKSGGLIYTVRAETCSLAARLRITLAWCTRLKHKTFAPVFYKNTT